MSKAIIKNEIPALSAGPFKVTRVGLVLDGEPTWDEWQAFFDAMQSLGDFRQWNIGDALQEVETKYGEAATQLTAQYPEHEYKALINWRWVAKKVRLSTRVESLSWAHHREVARLKAEEQRKWLALAGKEGWSKRELSRQIRTTQIESSPHGTTDHVSLYHGDMVNVLTGMMPDLEPFDVIVTDPPYGVTDHEWDQLDIERWLKWLLEVLSEDKYTIFWFCSPKHIVDTELLFLNAGLEIQSRIVWHRRNMALGSAAKNRFIDTWEMIIHAGNRPLNFPDEWSDAWFDVQIFPVPQTNFEDMKLHPTQKPAGLIERLVQFGSYPGDRILDPFAGSGTTGAVCPGDRECVLIEREEEYVEVAEKRLGISRQALGSRR